MLTFFAEIFIIRTALAVRLTLGVTVTLPPSFKGLKAAAFTGKIYPEQNKTLWIIDDTATPRYEETFSTLQLTRAPKMHFQVLYLEFGKWMASQEEIAQVKKEI